MEIGSKIRYLSGIKNIFKPTIFTHSHLKIALPLDIFLTTFLILFKIIYFPIINNLNN